MKRHILIIDDDTILLKILSTVLISEGYHVTTKKNLKIKSLNGVNSDLILIDLWLTDDTTSLPIIKKIKTPLVLMSADPDLDFICKKNKIKHYLKKPFSIEDLIFEINYFFN